MNSNFIYFKVGLGWVYRNPFLSRVTLRRTMEPSSGAPDNVHPQVPPVVSESALVDIKGSASALPVPVIMCSDAGTARSTGIRVPAPSRIGRLCLEQQKPKVSPVTKSKFLFCFVSFRFVLQRDSKRCVYWFVLVWYFLSNACMLYSCR